MILLMECILACMIFSLIFVIGTLKNKLSFFSEYAPAIQKKYMELHPDFEPPTKKMTPGVAAAKIGMCLFFLAVLTAMVYYAGARTFLQGLGYSYLIWTVVNIFDVFVLDMGVFMFWKKVRLPGTEDMDREYRQNVMPSLRGGLYGIFIGIPVCLLCGALTALL